METNSKTRVVITHDFALVAAGIASTLEREPDIEVAVQAAFAQRHEADIVIGSCENAVSLMYAASHARGAAAGPKVMMVTIRETDSEIRAAMAAGIHWWLPIDCGEQELLSAVRSVARGTQCAARAAPASRHRPRPRGGLAPGALRRVCTYIDAHLDQEILVKALAEIAQLSVYHFARAFKQSLGVTPHRFVQQRRIALAAEQVEHTERSLSDIALSVGCSDQSHFTAMFTRFVGETPGAFRRARR